MKILSQQEFEELSPIDRQQYEESLKRYRDYHNTIATAEKEAFEKGIKQGREQGIEEGIRQVIEEAFKQGIEQGKQQEKINMTKRLISLNFDNQIIEKITELTLTEIEEIKNLMEK